MWRERTNLFPCRKTQFCDTLRLFHCLISAYKINIVFTPTKAGYTAQNGITGFFHSAIRFLSRNALGVMSNSL